MGSRGASSGRGQSKAGTGNGTFANETDFENSLSGLDDPRLQEYSDAYETENAYTNSLVKNLTQSINEDGYTSTVENALNYEQREAQNFLDSLPDSKTPEQLGQESAMKERLQEIKKLKGRLF